MYALFEHCSHFVNMFILNYTYPQVRDAQKSALIDAVQNMDGEQAGNAIYQVLQQRHMQERVQLEEQFTREIAAAKAEARARTAEGRLVEREEIVAQQDKVSKETANFHLYAEVFITSSSSLWVISCVCLFRNSWS